MNGIIEYALAAYDAFSDRPLGRVDALCLSWLAYLRYPEILSADTRYGMRLVDIASLGIAPQMVAHLHDASSSERLLLALAASPRFADVRACLHESSSDMGQIMQFSGTTFVLPGGSGSFVAFRGTDDTTLGWKENFRLGGSAAVAAQRQALRYLERVTEELGGRFWVGGHSKGGNLAEYASSFATDAVRGQLERVFSLDGPGLSLDLRTSPDRHHDVALDKIVPQDSLVGMMFEHSQSDLIVVRSTGEGFRQHDPFTWEVRGNDFVSVQGMTYEAWRFARRLNDWLGEMSAEERDRFAEMLSLLVDATAEPSFSGLLRRWSSNRLAMRAVLENMPAEDRGFFERVLDDLATTLLLGSKAEHGIVTDGVEGLASAAGRKLEDAAAHARDRLSKLDRLAGL